MEVHDASGWKEVMGCGRHKIRLLFHDSSIKYSCIWSKAGPPRSPTRVSNATKARRCLPLLPGPGASDRKREGRSHGQSKDEVELLEHANTEQQHGRDVWRGNRACDGSVKRERLSQSGGRSHGSRSVTPKNAANLCRNDLRW